ncbi:ABC transporter substrate-binding protein [Solirubrobacter sp. CPCC 204708]|uniref:ABC transporter substrate-binding protein n=1 Tax=Solirubrobacter deserti TaxID=2282478 RepID=A0ABT4RU76_9ACTN|nr:ABC transporter substrate-binding protein [Solirubrobacter deserti]MBE2316336.1 ABC transporter substrate-binding protein [Solirubrobacter deserti]MDA0142132.1 ABC transporter substrate-binding protein [Solirubrobacter deserti]
MLRLHAVLMTAAVLAIAGCGAQNSSSDSGSPRAAAGGEGGTVRVAVGQRAGNLDPHDYAGLFQVQDLLFEGLVKYDRGGEIAPSLAESWEVSEDGLTYTFKLREGVKFTDGTPVDAEAVEWNFKRWAGKEDTEWLGLSRVFKAMKVVDPMTFELTLEQAYPPALQELAYIRPVRLLSPQSVDAEGLYTKPVGTGAWVLEKSDRNGASFNRNEDYWGTKPKPARLELDVIPDAQTRLSALRAGDVDIIGGEFTAPLTPRNALALKNAANVKLVNETGTGTLVLAFNEAKAPFNDQRLRTAVNKVIDRKAIAKALYFGFGEPAGNLFPESVPFSGARQEIPAVDKAAAAQLVKAAGYGPGKPLKVTLLSSEDAIPGGRAMAEVIQSAVKEIGIQVEVRLVDHATRHKEIAKRAYDLAFYATYAAPYDPYGSFGAVFDSRTEIGVDGKIFMDAKHLDPMIDDALAATGDEIEPAFEQIYTWLRERDAFVPLVYTQRIWAHSDKVQGLELPATEYELPLHTLSVLE